MKQLLKVYSLIALLVMLVSMLFIAIPWENVPTKDLAVMATFILNGTVWGFLLFYELTKRAYSLLIIHWLFCFLFFFCIAFAQYMYGVFPWVALRSDELLLQINFLLLVWTLFVWIGYRITFSRKRNKHLTVPDTFQVPGWLVAGLTGFTLINAIYRVATVGFSALLARGTASVSYGIESSSAGLFVGHTLQAISFFAAIFSFTFYKQKHKGLLWVGITLLCLLVSYFPTALSRHAAAAIYGGLMLTMFMPLRKSRVFIALLLAGFLVILPFLNAFRGVSFAEVDMLEAVQRVFNHLADDWLAGDYDAYAMLTLIWEHVQCNGITWGLQLLGVFLFWVPRTWWVAKPMGTGAFVSTQLGWQFTNLSAPLPAEALINFGWGYVLFAIILGGLMGKLDGIYWTNLDVTEKTVRKYDLLYPVLIMFFFFMNRGDLLSSTAYMMAYVGVWFVLVRCCKHVN